MTAEQWALVLLKGTGALTMLYALGRGFRWCVEFSVGRIDKRQEALSVKEKEFEARVDGELRALRGDVARLTSAVHKLSAELHRKDPGNPVLGEVANIIAGAWALPSPEPGLNDLMARAGKGLDDFDAKGGKA